MKPFDDDRNIAFHPIEYIQYGYEALVRRKWLILIPFFLSGIVGITLALLQTKIYSASTFILVEPQTVSSNYVQSIVSSDIESRIGSLSQEILSRTNLEKIINEFKLFSGPEYSNMFLEDKVDALRKNILVQVSSDRYSRSSRGGAFSITVRGKQPKQIADITNALATYFIDQNLKLREDQAIGTSDFLQDELSTMRSRLEDSEQALKKYRENNMGKLPEQLDTNLRILEGLRQDLANKEENLRDAKSRLLMLHSQANEGSLPSQGSSSDSADAGMSLVAMRNELARLKSRYTDQHPDILRMQQRIADAEKELSADGTSKGSHREPAAIIEIKREISGLENAVEETRQQIKLYQARVETTPEREQELAALQRDYNNMQASYQSLLNRKLEAEIAVNLERKQKGEQFRVIDPARVPQSPDNFKTPRLLLFSLVAGLGSGFGLVFLLEFVTDVFRRPAEIESLLALPILATIPSIVNTKKRIFARISAGFAWVTGLLACAVYLAFASILVIGDGWLNALLRHL